MRSAAACAVVLLLAVFAGAARAAPAPVRARTVMSCLRQHHVLVGSIGGALPAGFPAVASLQFSFALVHGQELNSGDILLEKTAAQAKALAAAWVRFSLLQAQRAGQTRITATLLKKAYFVANNAIVFWSQPSSPGRLAARHTIAGCLIAPV
jgi:hypothetical protein